MSNRDAPDLKFVKSRAARRRAAHVDQQMGVAEYRRGGDVIAFLHTEAPPALEGRSIASRLVLAALVDTHLGGWR